MTSTPLKSYVHGYAPRENQRLQDQASTLAELLHSDTHYPTGSQVLEAGCGVGSQTVSLAQNSPLAHITAVDISASSLAVAQQRVQAAGCQNVTFHQVDIFDLPFASATFDHVFVCFVLEHLAQPVQALQRLGALLKPGGTLTVIEGDHGSAYFYPDNAAARQAIECQVTLQQQAGGNANIGRALFPLLRAGGFATVQVSPRMVYVDASRPSWVEGFTQNTFTAMIEGVRDAAIAAQLISAEVFDAGIQGLHRTTEADGVFCYTFFKATARKPSGQET